MSESFIESTRKDIDAELERAIEAARKAPFPKLKDLESDDADHVNPSFAGERVLARKSNLVVSSLNAGLHRLMDEREDVVFIGEDILDPYGGAFKVSKGLSTKHPGRCFSSPISEAGIVGLATGMALRGLRPVVEIMFGDFSTLIVDQLLNHAKYQWMYNNQVTVPLVIRTPMGGKRGYGPTHSQSIEKLFLGIPGLTVVAPSVLTDPGEMLYRAVVHHDCPLLFIENKAMYTQETLDVVDEEFSVKRTEGMFPTFTLSLAEGEDPDIVLIAYGDNCGVAMEVAMELLIEHEILVDVVAPTMLAPFPTDDIVEAVSDASHVFTLEEGTMRMGWGTEVLAQLAEARPGAARTMSRIAAPDCPIPNCKPLELELLPNASMIKEKILTIYYG